MPVNIQSHMKDLTFVWTLCPPTERMIILSDIDKFYSAIVIFSALKIIYRFE